MATPLGHSLAGYAVAHCSGAVHNHERNHPILLSLFMANAPDLDFLPGLLMGSPALYHQSPTHSLGVALIVSLGAAGLSRRKGWSFSGIFRLCFVSYLSHLVIDFFGPDGRLPYGIPLFWPISEEYFISPVSVFWGVHHAGSTYASTLEWISSILDLQNLGAVVLEISFITPFIFVGRWWKRGPQARGV